MSIATQVVAAAGEVTGGEKWVFWIMAPLACRPRAAVAALVVWHATYRRCDRRARGGARPHQGDAEMTGPTATPEPRHLLAGLVTLALLAFVLSLGDLIEGIVLHAFEGKAPFTKETLGQVEQLRKIYGLTLRAADSHNLREPRRAARRKPRES